MYGPYNQPPPIGSNIPPHGYSAFASWNSSQSAQNGRSYVGAPHGPNMSASPFHRPTGNSYMSQRVDGAIPPQPAFSVSLCIN
jgi:hypothetical protein